MRINQLGPNAPSLQPIDHLPHLLQLLHLPTLRPQLALLPLHPLRKRIDDQLVDRRGVDLKVESAGDGVLPQGRESLDLVLSPRREFGEGDLFGLGDEAETGREGGGGGHPAEEEKRQELIRTSNIESGRRRRYITYT
jgi:hypothetical protein